MKSIKEKAQENNKIVGRISPNKRIVYMYGREQFEAGANYVLEQIEEFQKLFSVCMNAHANGYLESVIEQLKK